MSVSGGHAQALAALIEGEVRFGRHDRLLYATDASIYQVEPLGVVVPRTVADAVETVRYCAAEGLAILPRGGGTSLAGQAVNRAVVIDFSPYCRRILEIDPRRRTATVEPGVVLDQLNREAARHGLMFGPDLSTSTHATLGGMIGNNSAGAHSILYGRTVEHLETVDLVLADASRVRLGPEPAGEREAALGREVASIVKPLAGEIRRRYPVITRRVNGYNLDLVLDQIERAGDGGGDLDLAPLVCGSEGTLGVTVGATVRLVEAPKARGLAIAAFGGLDEALAALAAILETSPAAVELIDDVIIRLALGNVEYRRYVGLLPRGGAAGAVLYVEYFAAGRGELDGRFAALRSALPDAAIELHTDPAAMEAAWKLRKAGEPLLHSIPGDRKPQTFIEDTAVDPARLPEFVRAFREIVAAHGTTAAYYAHASVGCLHIRPMICLRDEADRAVMEAIAIEVTDLVRSFGGALSGEHGDGRARSHLLERFYGREICEGFRRVRTVFDPRNLMNPGNIVEPQAMTVALRVAPHDETLELPRPATFFRFEREHGFGAAVELCNGSGLCRKTAGGTMCPSYRALLDERHATRGRANALRLAITGQLDAGGEPAWDDPDTIETLDLCLSCKACKAECPSNVDMARLKAEYTAQRYEQAGGAPFRARVFAGVRRLNQLGSALHPVANALAAFEPSARLLKGALGVHRDRSLPRFGSSLHRWMARRWSLASGPAVVLLPDCFSVYTEPHVGRAAVTVLESLGYHVVVPHLGCCGRAHISSGLLDEAQRVCAATARALVRCVDDCGAEAVVGCEPSCVSAITDDWQDLDMDADPDALRRLADMTVLVEQFAERHWQGGEAPGAGPVLLHAHCHQKALLGAESSAGLLRRVAGDRVRVLDTGCCGMAGAFGYTRHHYDLSMRIGELDLFGAVRGEPGAMIVAPGTSCRHQILDGTGRRAIHPIELAERALDGRAV